MARVRGKSRYVSCEQRNAVDLQVVQQGDPKPVKNTESKVDAMERSKPVEPATSDFGHDLQTPNPISQVPRSISCSCLAADETCPKKKTPEKACNMCRLHSVVNEIMNEQNDLKAMHKEELAIRDGQLAELIKRKQSEKEKHYATVSLLRRNNDILARENETLKRNLHKVSQRFRILFESGQAFYSQFQLLQNNVVEPFPEVRMDNNMALNEPNSVPLRMEVGQCSEAAVQQESDGRSMQRAETAAYQRLRQYCEKNQLPMKEGASMRYKAAGLSASRKASCKLLSLARKRRAALTSKDD